MLIVREEINRDLDDYIGRRRSTSRPFRKAIQDMKDKLKPKETHPSPDDEIFDEHKGKSYSFVSKVFRRRIPTEDEIEQEVGKMPEKDKQELEDMEGEVEEIDAEEEVMEENREGVMKRFFKKLRITRKEDHMPEETGPDPQIEELKNTIKILHTWIQRLPPEEIQAFKQSPDFERYKDALRKLKLIKE